MEGDGPSPTASETAAKIPLGRMQSQREVRTMGDDWTGLTDAAERRKLQNRLNQRIYRKRRRAKPDESSIISETHLADRLKSSSHELNVRDENNSSPWSTSSTEIQYYSSKSSDYGSEDSQTALLSDSSSIHSIHSIHGLNATQLINLVNRFELLFRQDYLLGSPRTDQLLTLIQFNVFRALLSNTSTMGFSISWLEDEDALSPFLSTSPPASIYNPFTPSSLLPSALQCIIPHHPWIDLWPFPVMRDNLLLAAAGNGYDEDALCNDLVDFYEVPHEKTGLIVWRDPWDPSGWEVSETFVRKWSWVLRGCGELLWSTNYWRGRRGEEELVWEV